MLILKKWICILFSYFFSLLLNTTSTNIVFLHKPNISIRTTFWLICMMIQKLLQGKYIYDMAKKSKNCILRDWSKFWWNCPYAFSIFMKFGGPPRGGGRCCDPQDHPRSTTDYYYYFFFIDQNFFTLHVLFKCLKSSKIHSLFQSCVKWRNMKK